MAVFPERRCYPPAVGSMNKHQRGFTLIELMIVVAIVGVLASIAVPLFMDAMKRSRNTEAHLQLNKIGKRATEEYHVNSTFPVAAAALTPTQDCCTQNVGGKRRCAVSATDWSTPEWAALDFSLNKEFLFQYSYTPGGGGTTYRALAVGDLDCDGTAITYQLDGSATTGTPTATLTEPSVSAD
jgi:prepilin-type N-terminal cleavage/methylation domain-containing protein